MSETKILNPDQFDSNLHTWEVLNYGALLVTDRSNSDTFLSVPINPPKYLSAAELLYLKDFYNNNRTYTAVEIELLNSLVIQEIDSQKENTEAILSWYQNLENIVGLIATKPNSDDFNNPLFWNTCPVEVVTTSGEICPFALINRRVPLLGQSSGAKRLLLCEIAEIRPSPYAIPNAVLKAARTEGMEFHMGDSAYPAVSNGQYCAVSSYYRFNETLYFFKFGTIKGSTLLTIPSSTDSESIIEKALQSADIIQSEAIECVIIDGLW